MRYLIKLLYLVGFLGILLGINSYGGVINGPDSGISSGQMPYYQNPKIVTNSVDTIDSFGNIFGTSFNGSGNGLTNINGFVQWQTNINQLTNTWVTLPVYPQLSGQIAGGGHLVLSNGIYNFSAPIQLTNFYATCYYIDGSGDSTCLVFHNGTPMDFITVSATNNAGNNPINIYLSHLIIAGTQDTTNFLVHTFRTYHLHFTDCLFTYWPQATNNQTQGLEWDTYGTTDATNLIGAYADGANGDAITIDNCNFTFLHQGLALGCDHFRGYSDFFDQNGKTQNGRSGWPTSSQFFWGSGVSVVSGGALYDIKLYTPYFYDDNAAVVLNTGGSRIKIEDAGIEACNYRTLINSNSDAGGGIYWNNTFESTSVDDRYFTNAFIFPNNVSWPTIISEGLREKYFPNYGSLVHNEPVIVNNNLQGGSFQTFPMGYEISFAGLNDISAPYTNFFLLYGDPAQILNGKIVVWTNNAPSPNNLMIVANDPGSLAQGTAGYNIENAFGGLGSGGDLYFTETYFPPNNSNPGGAVWEADNGGFTPTSFTLPNINAYSNSVSINALFTVSTSMEVTRASTNEIGLADTNNSGEIVFLYASTNSGVPTLYLHGSGSQKILGQHDFYIIESIQSTASIVIILFAVLHAIWYVRKHVKEKLKK